MCAFTPSNVHLRNRKCDICRRKFDTMTKNWKLFVFPQHHKQQLSINCFFETQLSCILWALALYRTQLKWQGIIRCLLRSWKQVMARPWAPFWWCAARRRPLERAVAVAALILWALDSCSLNRKPRCIKTVHLNIHLTLVIVSYCNLLYLCAQKAQNSRLEVKNSQISPGGRKFVTCCFLMKEGFGHSGESQCTELWSHRIEGLCLVAYYISEVT